MKGDAMRAIFNFMSLETFPRREEMLRQVPLLSGCGQVQNPIMRDMMILFAIPSRRSDSSVQHMLA